MVGHEPQCGQPPSLFDHPTALASRPLHSFLAVLEQPYALPSARGTVHQEGPPYSAQYEGLLPGYQTVDQVH
jgi:hypothetical protein